MGMYVNTGNGRFEGDIRSEIYVDKTGLLGVLNSHIGTSKRYIAVSRARRFGKSMAANMMQAYYCHTCDSSQMFAPYEIARPDGEGENKQYLEQLNKYNVLMLDMGSFVSNADLQKKDPLQYMAEVVLPEFCQEFPLVFREREPETLASAISRVYNYKTEGVCGSSHSEEEANGKQVCKAPGYGKRFVVIIDEWDCIIRENPLDSQVVKDYIQFLRSLFKSNESKDFLALAYITGILPIKKLKGESVVNDFREYTMISPKNLSRYFGFTEEEVKALCAEYGADMDVMKKWYDGYIMNEESIYNPNSVVNSLMDGCYESYWTNTSSFETVNRFLEMDYEGLREDAVKLISGDKERVKVNVKGFKNDLNDICSRDDCLTALVHLGYLGYDAGTGEAFIPNYEVSEAFESALATGKWKDIRDALEKSDRLLDATLKGDAAYVAKSIQQSRMDYSSIIAFNDENALASAIMIAYYTARKDYMMVREFPSGRGFADIAFIPRKGCKHPPMIVELKWDKSAETAIGQIKARNYAGKLAEYSGEILLIGINYDKQTGEVDCVIEGGAESRKAEVIYDIQ